MRTTVDIDTPVMKDLKKIRQREGKSLGPLAQEVKNYGLRSIALAGEILNKNF